MIMVNERPFSNAVPLKAIERLTKNKVSAQPDRLVFPVIQKIIENKTQTTAIL